MSNHQDKLVRFLEAADDALEAIDNDKKFPDFAREFYRVMIEAGRNSALSGDYGQANKDIRDAYNRIKWPVGFKRFYLPGDMKH